MRAFHRRFGLPEPNWNRTIERYEARLEKVRAANYLNPRYFEICFGCGDDGFTLARSLGLDLRKVAQLPAGWQSVHRNAHPAEEGAERVQTVREHAAAIALYRGSSGGGGKKASASKRAGKGARRG